MHMETPSIEELRLGAEPAWSWFVKEFSAPVSHYARRLGHPDPDEVLGATLETIVRRIERFEGGPSQLRSFVFFVAHARIVDELRSSHFGRVNVVSEFPDQVDELFVELSPAFAELNAATKQLSDKQRLVVFLRYVDGMSTREVARAIGESEVATRVILSRSIHKLRELLVEVTARNVEDP